MSTKPIKYQKHLLDVSNVPINDILESTHIPEDIFLRDFIEYILEEYHQNHEFYSSVWQIPEDQLTPGVPRKEETERIRQVLITWASLYSGALYDSINEMFELDMFNIEQLTEVKLVDGTHLLVEVEQVEDD